MSAPWPSALRARFKRCIEEGLSGRAAALRLKLSPATGARWARQVRTRGHALPALQGRPPGRGKLAPYRTFFEELIAKGPDIALFELRDALADAEGVQVHHSPIANLLSRLGFTYKKSRPLSVNARIHLPVKGSRQSATAPGSERHRARVRHQRADWFTHRLPAIGRRPERVVFIPTLRCKQRLPGSG